MGEQQSGQDTANYRRKHISPEKTAFRVQHRPFSPAKHQRHQTGREIPRGIQPGLRQRRDQAKEGGNRQADEDRRFMRARPSGMPDLQ